MGRYGTRGRLESLPREGRCAIKWLHSSTPAARKTLRDEIRLLSKCRHENLLPLFDQERIADLHALDRHIRFDAPLAFTFDDRVNLLAAHAVARRLA